MYKCRIKGSRSISGCTAAVGNYAVPERSTQVANGAVVRSRVAAAEGALAGIVVDRQLSGLFSYWGASWLCARDVVRPGARAGRVSPAVHSA
jgi:hypothetical protein